MMTAEQNRKAAERSQEVEKMQREIADQERIRAAAAEEEAKRQAYIANQKRVEAEEMVSRLGIQLYAKNISDAQHAYENLQLKNAIEILLSCPQNMRHWEWYFLWHVSTTTGNQRELPSGAVLFQAHKFGFGAYEHTSLLGGALKRFEGHNSDIIKVVFSPDSKYLFSVDLSGELKVWSIDNEKEVQNIKLSDLKVLNFCLSPKGDKIAISTDDRVAIIDLNGDYLNKQLSQHPASYRDGRQVSWSPDGRYIAFGSRSRTINKRTNDAPVIKIWDILKDEIVHTLKLLKDEESFTYIRNSLSGDAHDIYALAFSPNSRFIAAGTNVSWCSNRTLWMWDIETGDEKITSDGQIVADLIFSPDGEQIVVSRGNSNSRETGKVEVWCIRNEIVLRELKGHSDVVTSVSYSSDGRRIVTSASESLRVWHADTGTELFRISLNPFMKYASYNAKIKAQFSPDCGKLAIWSDKGGWMTDGKDIWLLAASSAEDVAGWKDNHLHNSQD